MCKWYSLDNKEKLQIDKLMMIIRWWSLSFDHNNKNRSCHHHHHRRRHWNWQIFYNTQWSHTKIFNEWIFYDSVYRLILVQKRRKNTHTHTESELFNVMVIFAQPHRENGKKTEQILYHHFFQLPNFFFWNKFVSLIIKIYLSLSLWI